MFKPDITLYCFPNNKEIFPSAAQIPNLEVKCYCTECVVSSNKNILYDWIYVKEGVWNFTGK